MDFRDTNRFREARRIGMALEDRWPILRRDTAGKDFRPGGGGEKIIGGVRTRIPTEFHLGDECGYAPISEDAPIEFSIVYGGKDLCMEGKAALESMGIEVEVIKLVCDGVEHNTYVAQWRLKWSLPFGWEIPE